MIYKRRPTHLNRLQLFIARPDKRRIVHPALVAKGKCGTIRGSLRTIRRTEAFFADRPQRKARPKRARTDECRSASRVNGAEALREARRLEISGGSWSRAGRLDRRGRPRNREPALDDAVSNRRRSQCRQLSG
jgi:hypothetical protein